MSSDSKTYNDDDANFDDGYEVRPARKYSLLYSVIRTIVEDTDAAVIDQIGEMLRIMLEFERMDKSDKVNLYPHLCTLSYSISWH